jgi:tetratricopeptide (TPR) repeat protein
MKRRAIPFAIIVLGFCLIFPLQRYIDANAPREVVSEEKLYLSSGESIKKMSLGLHGLAADIYWIRTVQYFGRKLIDSRAPGEPPSFGSTREIRMDLLAPLLDIVVTLDPQHISAYRFGAIFLPERDMPAAISLLERGIEANPKQWRLYQDLGYIYWQAGNEATGEQKAAYFAKAAEWYGRGSKIEGARDWMADMAGLMTIQGGERATARKIYQEYLTSEEPHIRSQAEARLKQIESLDQRDVINEVLRKRAEQSGACPASLRTIARELYSKGLTLNNEMMPVDPDGLPYSLNAATCRAELDNASKIPQ